MVRFALFLTALASALLLVGCDALGGGDPIRTLDGNYDLDATLTVTAGNIAYDGSVSLEQHGDSLAGEGQVTVSLDGDPQQTWVVNDVTGTYDHPNLTMIWTVENVNEPNPSEARSIWAIDGTVGPRADSIGGLIEVADEGNGSITLTKK